MSPSKLRNRVFLGKCSGWNSKFSSLSSKELFLWCLQANNAVERSEKKIKNSRKCPGINKHFPSLTR